VFTDIILNQHNHIGTFHYLM